ncbi:DUF6233 domain-containing protein [Streptomyces sp. DT203]|uniref:DUF6233 domain-containing protein n=1 Tax=Streptomyces sp. DT203 TaxID=3393424 RepID=UPI003CECF5B8
MLRGGKRQRGITRDQALAALADGMRACIHCRPDTEFGVLGYVVRRRSSRRDI